MKKWIVYALTWIVVIAIVAAVYQFAVVPALQPPADNEKAVREGSNVKVNYIGMLAPEYGGGLVFDTSLYNVAIDNKSYPKTPTFQMRPKYEYKPLMVHVGDGSDGSYTSVIEGFKDGLIGMKPGETKTIVIPPEKGYGYGDPNLIEKHPLVENVTIKEQYPNSRFLYVFGKNPKVGMVVENPKFHWNMTVENVMDGYCILDNQPQEGATYFNGRWYVKVINMDSSANNGNGSIEVRNLIGPDDAYHIKGSGVPQHSTDGKKKTFVLTEVDLQNGTYTIDYNDLTRGRTLIFTVELVSIDKY